MIEDDFERIPDLDFDIQILVSEPPRIASRLLFDVTPTGEFLGLPVNGRRVIFCENVFCNFQDQRIQEVGRIDKAAIEIQLRLTLKVRRREPWQSLLRSLPHIGVKGGESVVGK
jgi:predicted ester cyclase